MAEAHAAAYGHDDSTAQDAACDTWISVEDDNYEYCYAHEGGTVEDDTRGAGGRAVGAHIDFSEDVAERRARPSAPESTNSVRLRRWRNMQKSWKRNRTRRRQYGQGRGESEEDGEGEGGCDGEGGGDHDDDDDDDGQDRKSRSADKKGRPCMMGMDTVLAIDGFLIGMTFLGFTLPKCTASAECLGQMADYHGGIAAQTLSFCCFMLSTAAALSHNVLMCHASAALSFATRCMRYISEGVCLLGMFLLLISVALQLQVVVGPAAYDDSHMGLALTIALGITGGLMLLLILATPCTIYADRWVDVHAAVRARWRRCLAACCSSGQGERDGEAAERGDVV